jgi:hypothetical protein
MKHWVSLLPVSDLGKLSSRWRRSFFWGTLVLEALTSGVEVAFEGSFGRGGCWPEGGVESDEVG